MTDTPAPETKGNKSTIGYRDAADTGVYTLLAKLISTGKAPHKVAEIDHSNMDSPDDYEESEGGSIKTGSVPLLMEHSPAQEVTLRGLLGLTKYWCVTYNSGATETFAGYLSEIGGDSIEKDKALQTKAAIRITGKPVYAPAL